METAIYVLIALQVVTAIHEWVLGIKTTQQAVDQGMTAEILDAVTILLVVLWVKSLLGA